GRRGVHEPHLFRDFTARCLEGRRVAWVDVTPRLEPAAEFVMENQKQRLEVGRQDEGARREVAGFEVTSLPGAGLAVELEHSRSEVALTRVCGRVRSEESRDGCRERHGSGFRRIV